MKSTVCVFLFILVSVEVLYCEGCLKHEREALLALNAQINAHLPWGEGTDCCQWDRVECSNTTGRVAKLALSRVESLENQYLNYSHFLVFEDLKSLDLSFNYIAGCVENEGLRLSNLEALDLSFNTFYNNGSILSCVNGFPSLKYLYLKYNNFNATSSYALEALSSKLLKLEVLDVSGSSDLPNDFLPSLRGFTSLKELYLNDIGLDSNLHIQGIPKLNSLELLDLANNELNDSILCSLDEEEFAWPTSLQDLRLMENNFSNEILSSLSGLQYLKSLDLSYNQLQGSLNISGLLASSMLEILDLRNNSVINFIGHQGSKSLNKLVVVYLDGNKIDGKMLRNSLRAFSSVRELYLSGNEFKGTIVAGDFRDLGKLECLAMDFSSNIVNQFFKTIGTLTSLKVLSLSHCSINGTLPAADWHKLQQLEELDMSFNKFEGSLPSSFCNMTNLRTLDLYHNHFIGNFGSNLASLTSLEYLDFEENQFDFPISFSPLANNTNLKFIHGKVIPESHPTLPNWVPKFQLQELYLSSTTETKSLPLPNFLFYQYNLTSVYFTGLKLEGEFPNWLLENNTKMTRLTLRNCSITGTFQLPSRPHLSILRIDVSDNNITGQIPSNNISSIFPNLEFLDMSINEIHGSLPLEIGHMDSLHRLDLSDNQLSGEIPENIFGVRSSLRVLRLSNNKLNGPIFPSFVESENLNYLDLSRNDLTGNVPSFVNSSVVSIHLSNNRLRGLSKRMFGETSFIEMLDLRYNKIATNIDDIMQDLSYTSVHILLLKGNQLTGKLPKQLCQLKGLTILDLSYNNFFGQLPNCLSEIPLAVDAFYFNRNGTDEANFTTKKVELTYTGSILPQMTGIDLSFNKLNGSIPSELGNLTNIRALNLSHNNLIGPIPATFSNLVQIESLDLSFNKLTGQIPPQLTGLTSLSTFSVAHNNLSGPTPDRKNQFPTFDESSYEGNPFLCGPPLPKSCGAPTILQNGSYTDGDNGHLVDMYVFCVSFVVSYTLVLLVIAAVLYINPYWRRAWFYYIEVVSTNCYYFIEDNLCKFSNIGNV